MNKNDIKKLKVAIRMLLTGKATAHIASANSMIEMVGSPKESAKFLQEVIAKGDKMEVERVKGEVFWDQDDTHSDVYIRARIKITDEIGTIMSIFWNSNGRYSDRYYSNLAIW